MTTAIVMMIPFKTSTVTMDTIPAITVNVTIAAAVMYIPAVGEIRLSVTMLRIHPPPRNWYAAIVT